MIGLRKSTTSVDMQKFLFSIVQQVEIKTIDWDIVAEASGITNAHAARMRYTRFRKQMEGFVPPPRNSAGRKRKTEESAEGIKGEKGKVEDEDRKITMRVKVEQSQATEDTPLCLIRRARAAPNSGVGDAPGATTAALQFPTIKPEPIDDALHAGAVPYDMNGNGMLQSHNLTHGPMLHHNKMSQSNGMLPPNAAGMVGEYAHDMWARNGYQMAEDAVDAQWDGSFDTGYTGDTGFMADSTVPLWGQSPEEIGLAPINWGEEGYGIF